MIKPVLIVGLAITSACATRTDASARTALVPAPPAVVPDKPAPPPQPRESELPDTVVASLDIACGDCHRSDRETAKPKALEVFDLTVERWWGELSPAELEVAKSRVDDRDEFTDADKLAFTQFVVQRKKALAEPS